MISIPDLLYLPLAGAALYAAATLARRMRNAQTLGSSGQPAEPDLTPLAALPVDDILRAEAVYERFYREQIRRLEMMNVAPIQEAATAAIEATHDCHIIAADLLRFATAIDAAATVEGRLAYIQHNQTIVRQSVTSSPNPAIANKGNESQAYYERALAFMRIVLSEDSAQRNGRRYEEAFVEHFPDMGGNKLLASAIENTLVLYKLQNDSLQIAACLAKLGLILRGVLYIGILRRTGSRLEREELLDRLKEALLAVTAVSSEVVHFAGLAKAIFEALAYTAQPKPTGHLDGVKAIGTYFASYEKQLSQWKKAAGSLRDDLSILVASLAPKHR